MPTKTIHRCDPCKYETEVKCNINRHNKTSKHLAKMKEVEKAKAPPAQEEADAPRGNSFDDVAQHFEKTQQSVIIFIVLFLLSISWEAIEIALPDDFSYESWEKKGMDVVINIAGFLFGTFCRWLWLCFRRKDV